MRALKAPGAKVVETNVFARFDASEGGALIDAHCLLSRWCAWKWSAWGGAAARAKRMHVLPNPVDAGGIGRVPEARARRRSAPEPRDSAGAVPLRAGRPAASGEVVAADARRLRRGAGARA